MPKPKLNDQTRDALRKEIQRAMKAGTPQARIFATLSKKYGVSSETIRYHKKALGGKGSAQAKKLTAQGLGTKVLGATKQKAPKKPMNGGRRQSLKAPAKPAARSHFAVRISDAVKGLSAKDLERALEARKLLPALEASRASAESLRTKARDAAVQAARLERQFRKLVR